MNAFRGRLLASGAGILCSAGGPGMDTSMFGNWMGQNAEKQPINGVAGNLENDDTDVANTDTNGKDNTSTNPDLIATIWDEKKDEPSSGGTKQNDQPATGDQPVQKTDEQMRSEVSAHLGSVGLGDFTLSAADVEKLASGENTHQEFANLVNTRIQQAYLQSMQSSQKLFKAAMEQQLPAMVKKAVDESKAFFEGDKLRSVLREALPFTTDPSIAPVAETVMRQFLVKGASKEKAVQLTKEYFERVRTAMDPNYVPNNPNTRTTFRGNPRTAMNFLDVLKGK